LRLNEALSEARRIKRAYTLAEVLVFANWIELITCLPEMQRHTEELLALSTEHGFQLQLGYATAFRASSLIMLGQAQEGLALLTKGLALIRGTGIVANTPYAFMGLAKAYAALGQQAAGLNALAEAAQVIDTTGMRSDEAELYRVRGDLVNATGDRATAEQNYHQALVVARRQSARAFELRAATSLARLWRDQGKRTEARDLLAPIYGWFTEGFDTPVLQDAKVLLDQLV
jgi:predicted ATPase